MKTQRVENYRLTAQNEPSLSYNSVQNIQTRVSPPAFTLRRFDPLTKKKQLSKPERDQTTIDQMQKMKQQRRQQRLHSRLATPDDKANLELEIIEGQNMTKMRKRRSKLQTEIVNSQKGKQAIHVQRSQERQRRINSINFNPTHIQKGRNGFVEHSLQNANTNSRDEQAALAEAVNDREMKNRRGQLGNFLAEQDTLQLQKWEELRRNFANGDR